MGGSPAQSRVSCTPEGFKEMELRAPSLCPSGLFIYFLQPMFPPGLELGGIFQVVVAGGAWDG